MRRDGRNNDQIRPFHVTPDFIQKVPGSALVEAGNTKVVCTAMVDSKVPYFLKESGQGWITAEYAMLPGSSGTQRVQRERNRINNRSIEIQRFIGRALRTTFNLKSIAEKTISLDTDVIQADGGTRCAALNGAVVALAKALRHLVFEHLMKDFPDFEIIAAVSLGIREQEILVDLDYEEDFSVDADINVVSSMTGRIVEVEAFAEKKPVPAALFKKAVDLGVKKNLEIIETLKKFI